MNKYFFNDICAHQIRAWGHLSTLDVPISLRPCSKPRQQFASSSAVWCGLLQYLWALASGPETRINIPFECFECVITFSVCIIEFLVQAGAERAWQAANSTFGENRILVCQVSSCQKDNCCTFYLGSRLSASRPNNP